MAEATTTILKPESLAKVLAVGSAPGANSLHTRKLLYSLYARQISVYEAWGHIRRHKWCIHNLPSCTACFLSTSVFLSRSLACDLSIPPSASPSTHLSPSLSPVVRCTHVNSHSLTHTPSRPQAQRCWWQVTVLSSHAPAQPVSWQIDPSIYVETNSIMHVYTTIMWMYMMAANSWFFYVYCICSVHEHAHCVCRKRWPGSFSCIQCMGILRKGRNWAGHTRTQTHTLTHIPPVFPFRHPFPPSDIRIERDSWLMICMTWWQSGSLQTLFIQCQMGRIAVAQILPGMQQIY